MAHRQIEMTNMAITYTTVLHSEVEKYGIEVAFTIANMDSLRRKNPRPDGGIVYLYELALKHGLVKNEPAFRRLIKKMNQLGTILITKRRMGATNINVYFLTEEVLSNPDRIALNKSRDEKLNTFTDPKKAEKATKRKEIMAAQTTWQNTPDMEAPSSPEPVVEKPSEQSDILTKAHKRQVVPAGLHKVMDNGSEMIVCSNGTDTPLVVQSRFKMQVMKWCVENNVEYVS